MDIAAYFDDSTFLQDAIQTLGGYDYLDDFPAERLYRDARVTKIYEGTNDIQHMIICREISRG